VADAAEGARVRQALVAAGFAPGGESSPRVLLMCGFLPEDIPAIHEYGVTSTVWTMEQLDWLRGSGIAVHVEIDTGMGRQGVRPGAPLGALLNAIRAAGIELDGVLTHFCAAEVAHSRLTQAQQHRFESAVAQVRAMGLRPKWVHAGSSSSVDNPAGNEKWLVELAKTLGARAMVRCGIALYGYCLPIDGGDATTAGPVIHQALKPVMTWKTRIMDVRKVAAGETIGYNATFTAPGPMRVALLPVGYSDGLRRELSSTNAIPGGWVMVRDRRAPIVGRISMNLTTVDVTGIDGVKTGDEVVLLGDGVTADDHARLARTISYEILCGIRAG
jgi:alanine racemase